MAQLMTDDERNFYRAQAELAKEQKEFLLQQKIFLNQQAEFMELQKKDIEEGKKDRKRMNDFTFILAFGVLVGIVFNMFLIFNQFKNANSVSILISSGIFMMIFVFFLIFTLDIFDMREKLILCWKNSWVSILVIIIFILIFAFFLITIPDRPLNSSITTLANVESGINQTNQILNQSLRNQEIISYKMNTITLNQNVTSDKLDAIILNQINLTQNKIKS